MSSDAKFSTRNPAQQERNLLAWVLGRHLTTPKGDPLEFFTSPWLVDIYQDQSRVMVIMKSSQARISTYAIYRALWFTIHNPSTVIFTEPTRDDAQKFSSSRVAPIINQSAYLLQYVGGGTELRKVSQTPAGIFKSHIFFRGTFGEKEAFTIDADELVIDEVDTSNPEVVATFDTRLIASKWKRKLKISTPSIPNYGIDAAYRFTDQRQWHFQCRHCNRWVNPALEYFDIIDRERFVFRCPGCGRPLERTSGEWVAAHPDREFRGYMVTQAICRYVPVSDIVAAELVQKPRKFANFWLGLPSEEGVATITRDLILQKCFLSGHHRSTSAVGAHRVMGVDQGNWLFYEVGEVGEDGRSHIVELGHTKEWQDLYTLMERHEIEACVIDALPERRLARALAHAFPGRVWMATYAKIPTPVRWRGKERYGILLNRSQCLDAAADDIVSGQLQLYVPRDGEIDEECLGEKQVGGWIQHWCNQHRIEPEEEGEEILWRETGPDHRSHANVYRKVAESRIRRRKVGQVWQATGGERTFGRAKAERPVVSEQELQELKELLPKRRIDLRRGQRYEH